MSWLTELSLLDGPLPWIVTIAGSAAALWLLLARPPWYVRRAAPLAATLSLVVTGILRHVVDKVWRPFPDPIALEVYVWIGIGLAALFLWVPRAIASRHRIRGAIFATLATVVVVARRRSAGAKVLLAASPALA